MMIMKMWIPFLVLVISIGVTHAGTRLFDGECDLIYQTVPNKPCSHYLEMTGINGQAPLTKDQFTKLNPAIKCAQLTDIVPDNDEICLRAKRPCAVTTISAGGKLCKDYIAMTAIYGRKAFTLEQFTKFNKNIKCNDPNKDVIPDGQNICLRLQNPCGQTIISHNQQTCKHYIKVTGLHGDREMTFAEFTKMNPNIGCKSPNSIIQDRQEICVLKNGLCHMSVRAVGNKPCSDYIALTKINGKEPLTIDQFAKLNPNLDCDQPETDIIQDGAIVCLRVNRPCGLTIRADPSKTCQDYLGMTGANGKAPLSKAEFLRLNPTLDCENLGNKVGEGAEVCLYSKSRFDNPEIQEGTTYEEFLKTAKPLTKARTRSRFTFDQGLFEKLAGLQDQLEARRRKRAATDDIDKQIAVELAKEGSVNSIKSVIEKNENFKALDEEYQTWRPKTCAEMRTQEQTEYKKCVCDLSRPFIQCQAIFTRDKDNIPAARQRRAAEAAEYMQNISRLVRAADNKWPVSKFIDGLTKGGCADVERCLSHTCISKEACKPLPLPVSFLSACINGEACIPSALSMALAQKNGLLPLNIFTETKLGLKIGLCFTEFKGLDVLSWLGLEKCLASIIFEYTVFKSQLDVSGQIALVVIRATITAKIQVMGSFSNGLFGRKFFVENNFNGDICDHSKHKCQDYCAAKPGAYGIGYKVEYWWWKWREMPNAVKEPQLPLNKSGC